SPFPKPFNAFVLFLVSQDAANSTREGSCSSTHNKNRKPSCPMPIPDTRPFYVYTQKTNPQTRKESHPGRSGPQGRRASTVVVTPPLMSLHIAPHAKRFAAPGVRALERLLARMRVAVDPQRARPRERLVARLADVAVLTLRERRSRRW